MPLPPPDPDRAHIHTRQITMTGWRCADGRWEVEAHLTDTKTYGFENSWRGAIPPGEPIHDMWIRLTVDDAFHILDIIATTDASPFAICPAITGNFRRLIGLKIGHGWMKEVKDRVGGIEGCTHLVELLAPMATTLIQTVVPLRAKGLNPTPESAVPAAGRGKRPPMLGSCHAFAESSPVVEKLWPSFYRPATDTEVDRGAAPAMPIRDSAP